MNFEKSRITKRIEARFCWISSGGAKQSIPSHRAWHTSAKTQDFGYHRMIVRLNNTVLTVPALVAFTGLILGRTSFAASVFGVPQTDWISDWEAESMIYSNTITDSATANHYVVSNRDFSPHSAVLQINLANRNHGSVLGDGALHIERAIQFQNSFSVIGTSASSPGSFRAAGVISQWARADHQGAIAWLSSISDSGNLKTRDEALAPFIETLSGNPDSGGFLREIIDGDRNRGDQRGSRNSVPQWYGDSICSCSEILASPGDLAVIPEPSSALLGALGGFLLLRRRRTS